MGVAVTLLALIYAVHVLVWWQVLSLISRRPRRSYRGPPGSGPLLVHPLSSREIAPDRGRADEQGAGRLRVAGRGPTR